MGLWGSAGERTAALAGPLRALLCLVDAQWPAVHLKAIQGLDGGLRLRLRHVDEPETAGLPGFAVIHQLPRIHFTVTLEQGLYVLFGGIEGQVAHINRRHPGLSLGKADSGAPHASVACTA